VKSLDADVIAQVEGGCIYPQRPSKTPPGYVEDLTESTKEVQTSFDRLLRGLEPEATIRIEEAAAVEDGQGTDVLRPDFIRPEDKPVFRTQPLHRRHLTSMPKSRAAVLGPLDPHSTARNRKS
jgi:hypothetical protein